MKLQKVKFRETFTMIACIPCDSMIDFEKSTSCYANPGICRNLRTKYLAYAEPRRSNLCPVDDIYSV